MRRLRTPDAPEPLAAHPARCTTFADAVRMLKKWDAWEEAPAAVRGAPAARRPGPGDGQGRRVRADGFPRLRGDARPPGHGADGEAESRRAGLPPYHPVQLSPGRGQARPACRYRISPPTSKRQAQPFEPPCALFTSGELLVTVGQEHGIGGRNQEFALAAALRLDGNPGIVVGAVDSDGTDGPGGQFWTGSQPCPAWPAGSWTALRPRPHAGPGSICMTPCGGTTLRRPCGRWATASWPATM